MNIGSRQSGRLKASSVIDCEPNRSSIVAAIDRLFSIEFQSTLQCVVNPYGTPGAAIKIVEIIENISLEGLLSKSFFDIN